MQKITFAVLVLAAACTSVTQRDTTIDRDAFLSALKANQQEAMAAHAAGDATRWANLFTPDGVILPEGAAPVTGTDSLVAWIRKFNNYDANNFAVTIEPVEFEVTGNWAYAWNRISGTVTPKAGGTPTKIEAKEIVIFRRDADGSWKAARVIFNSNAPAAPGS